MFSNGGGISDVITIKILTTTNTITPLNKSNSTPFLFDCCGHDFVNLFEYFIAYLFSDERILNDVESPS